MKIRTPPSYRSGVVAVAAPDGEIILRKTSLVCGYFEVPDKWANASLADMAMAMYEEIGGPYILVYRADDGSFVIQSCGGIKDGDPKFSIRIEPTVDALIASLQPFSAGWQEGFIRKQIKAVPIPRFTKAERKRIPFFLEEVKRYECLRAEQECYLAGGGMLQ